MSVYNLSNLSEEQELRDWPEQVNGEIVRLKKDVDELLQRIEKLERKRWWKW